MKVKKLISKYVKTFTTDENLSDAIEEMRLKDSSAVPIVNAEGKLVGIISDREVSLAISEVDKKPSEIKIGDMISEEVVSCRAKNEVKTALKIMRRKKIKHLPVVNKDQKVVGVLSVTEMIGSKKIDKSEKKKIFSTLKAIVKSSKAPKTKPIVLSEIVK